jgi:hypothetical protein
MRLYISVLQNNYFLKSAKCLVRDELQGYHTPQEVVADVHGAMGEQWLAARNQRNSEQSLLQYNFLHHEFHMKSPGIKFDTPG